MTKSFNEIREAYLAFMRREGHAIIPSAPLVPQNDPTTLFTGSGMQPLVPYLLGKDHPAGTRLADSQKCFRSMDIEEVGDNRHTTFFEMLGNWSLGDYFKEEQLGFFFRFLTDDIGLKPEHLYVTTFIGDEDNNVPRDTLSVETWKKLFSSKGIDAHEVLIGSEEEGYRKGMQGGRIFYYDAKKNWWSRAGVPAKMPVGEPGGPDSEVFYDFSPHSPHIGGHANDTDHMTWGSLCHPNCDCGRFLEIGNSVFMQYIKTLDGSFALLPKQNVDFGGGLERIAAAANQNADVFLVGPLFALITELEHLSGKSYGDTAHTQSFRVIADHIRAAAFLIADGIVPSNSDQGYFVRRLLRRAVRFADKLELPHMSLGKLVVTIITEYASHYMELGERRSDIETAIDGEEEKFRRTLARGLKHLAEKAQRSNTSLPTRLEGQTIFELYTTEGFPYELIVEAGKEYGFTEFDHDGFKLLMEDHRNNSRAGAEQKFKGGLADQGEATTRLHTAHHLLLKALQIVLGNHVHQRGSNITAERLRIDFSHGEKLTEEQKREVERIVNVNISLNLPVIATSMKREEAEKLNAEHEFGARYPDIVTIYSIGPKGATFDNPQFGDAFSIEFCGGPHVKETSELLTAGSFVIQKEEASSAGVRRIKAILR
jgi:alanyl-tRNA synthetase